MKDKRQKLIEQANDLIDALMDSTHDYFKVNEYLALSLANNDSALEHF
jgi:uncharacterized protein involved in cysteine biosynthesis